MKYKLNSLRRLGGFDLIKPSNTFEANADK